MVIC